MQRWLWVTSLGVMAVALLTGASYAPSNSNWPSAFSIYARLTPLAPAPGAETNYPLGHDLWLMAKGSADVHVMAWSLNVTSSTSLTGGGGAQTIAVGTPKLCPSTATSDPNCVTSSPTATGWFCPPAALCTVTLDPDTANAETLTASNWSVASSTTLSVTPTKSHTQPFTVQQSGAVFLDARALHINSSDVSDRPMAFEDRNNNPYLILPNDTGGTFPTSATQFAGVVTGGNGASKHFLYRQAGTSSCFNIVNNANTYTQAFVCDSALSGVLSLGNTTNTPLSFQGTSDIPRIVGGGTANGLRLDLSRSGTGTNGTLSICNNSTDELCGWTVKPGASTTNATVATLGGSLRSGTASNTDMVGLITLTGGAGSYTFVNTYSTPPVCNFADRTTHANTFTWAVSTTAITISAGTGTDVIQYQCTGLN